MLNLDLKMDSKNAFISGVLKNLWNILSIKMVMV
jgi:hypothetical protein